ncbi:MAG: GGDEF domain-containing protein [Oscillospiraceae bacterium]|nr:GGDEF domain-containing protein [Oscillospiraceae bacterium]
MRKFGKFLKRNFDKVNVQVSVLTCALVIFSCLIIYLVTSAIMVSMLTEAYDERANLTFDTIEEHLDKRLYEDEVPYAAYSSVMSYLSAIKDNMAISDILIYKKNVNKNNVTCILDTQNANNPYFVQSGSVEEEICEYVDDMYEKNYIVSGDFILTDVGYRYANFYPISEDGRNVKAVVGIMIDAQNVRTFKIILHNLVAIIIFLCCLISIRFSHRIFKKISNPLYQDASNTDGLTGLKSRNAYSVDLHNAEASNVERYSAITIDLNGLKHINDTRGHQMGDLYIQRAAKILRDTMNENPSYVAYRIGGDEFTIIAKDKSLDDLKKFVEEVDRRTEEGNKGNGITLTMSIGYAKFDPEQDRNFSATIERSDSMMYENKRKFYAKKNMEMK